MANAVTNTSNEILRGSHRLIYFLPPLEKSFSKLTRRDLGLLGLEPLLDILLPSVDLLRLSQITEEYSSPLVNKDGIELIKPLSYSGHIHQLLLIISASIDYKGWPTINICDVFFVSSNNNMYYTKVAKNRFYSQRTAMTLTPNALPPLKLKILEMQNLGLRKHLFPVVRITTCRRAGVPPSNRPGISNKTAIVYATFFCNFLTATSGVRGQYKFPFSRYPRQ